MRHANKKKRLGRNASHRKATLQSLSIALIRHKRIETTLARAKALRPFVEPILHRAKDDSTASRRQAFRKLQDKEATKTLFGDVAEVIGDRPGGYTRIVKLGQRAGDAAEMAMIELVDFNNVQPEGTGGTKRKTRRSRRRSGGSPEATAPATKATTASPKAAASGAAEETSEEAEAQQTPEASGAEAPEQQKAEAVSKEAANPDAVGNPQIPQTEAGSDHPDAEQGATTSTGEPPPESEPENRGRSGHRG